MSPYNNSTHNLATFSDTSRGSVRGKSAKRLTTTEVLMLNTAPYPATFYRKRRQGNQIMAALLAHRVPNQYCQARISNFWMVIRQSQHISKWNSVIKGYFCTGTRPLKNRLDKV